jgi:hypothetical protein
MSAAQKKARENFKKAIAYRKKTGCSLKQAFAYVKGGKVGVVKKAVVKKKAVKKVVRKKAAKKVVSKKPVSSHKDTKSHNVNIRVVSGVNDFWVKMFAPRSRSWQISTYREIKNQISSNYKNPFESREQLIQQLRALEYILNKKPFIIK